MQRTTRNVLAAICGAIIFTSNAFADPKLKIGDPAPALAVSKFVKGEPVKQFDKGTVYVVEFWATWCPPCRESIPHLTALQKANPDITFIGVDSGEDASTVTPFVTKMGDKMDYRVAVDDLTKAEGATDAAYMKAAEQEGIPTAFLVGKESTILWIGHPMELEPILKQLAAGTFDPKKAAAQSAARQQVMELLQKNDSDGAMKLSKELIDKDAGLLPSLGMLQFEVLVHEKKDAPAAAKRAEEIMPKIDDSGSLGEIAWMLSTSDKPTADTLATAQKAADLALTKSPDDARILDAVARVYAVKGDFKQAVTFETKAIDKSKDDEEKTDLSKSLEAFKSGKLPPADQG